VPELAAQAPPGVVVCPPAGPQRPRRHLFAASRSGAERAPALAAVVEALMAVGSQRQASRAESAPRARRVPATGARRRGTRA
jgi:hypothetical protein